MSSGPRQVWGPIYFRFTLILLRGTASIFTSNPFLRFAFCWAYVSFWMWGDRLAVIARWAALSLEIFVDAERIQASYPLGNSCAKMAEMKTRELPSAESGSEALSEADLRQGGRFHEKRLDSGLEVAEVMWLAQEEASFLHSFDRR